MSRYIVHFSVLNIHVLRPSAERKAENDRYFDSEEMGCSASISKCIRGEE